MEEQTVYNERRRRCWRCRWRRPRGDDKVQAAKSKPVMASSPNPYPVSVNAQLVYSTKTRENEIDMLINTKQHQN